MYQRFGTSRLGAGCLHQPLGTPLLGSQPPEAGLGVGAEGNDTQCSNSPDRFNTFFSPASTFTAKRFCFGGSGQLKL